MGKIDIEGYTELPALSVLQPWAALIAGGAKRIENRSWPPSIELRAVCLCLIQAGQKKPSAKCLAEVKARVRRWAEPDRRKARRILDDPDNWHYGALVALVRFSRFTGNQHGRQWHIDKVQRVAATPVTGQLGLFKVPVAKVKLL